MSAKKSKKPRHRLHFTDDERSDPKLKRPIEKAQKAAGKLDAAQAKIPTKKVLVKERTLDAVTTKSKVRLHFEEVEKPAPPSKMAHAVQAAPALEVHRQVARIEDDNVGVESGHKTEEAAEFSVRSGQSAYRSHKLKPYRTAARVEKQLDKANISCLQQKAVQENPQLASNPISRWQQKQAIKKEYAAAKAGKSTQSVKTAAETARKTAKITKEAAEKTVAFIAQHKEGLLIALGIFFIIVMIMNAMSSCSQIAMGGLSAFLSTSYTAEDQEICAADLEYTRLEAEQEYEILRVESDYPGYDEYRYTIDQIGHDPQELIAYLTAKYDDFTFAEVQAEIQSVFSAMYTLSITERIEVRYRTETRYVTYTVTDPETGETTTYTDSYEVEVPYDYTILNVVLNSKSLYSVIYPRMTAQQREMFLVYMDTKGSKQYFGNPFSFNWPSHVTSLYGWRMHPISQKLQIHRGLDLAVPLGTPIHSIHDGRVITVGYDSGGYGNYVVIEDDDGYRSIYAHCSSVGVSAGQTVARGEVIAAVGGTGASTGSHLHLELSYNGEYLNPYFFIQGTDPYTPPAITGSNGEYTDYDIPTEALSDARFAALITEAEKYLGYPYVWGGSTPATSFDCSGFVCWVFKNSGVYPISRTTAQGIFNQCAIINPAEAKPGDLLFFTGTYVNDEPVTHVAIYVGDGMMIHAGKPIQYASFNTSYWQSHFYAFGRISG